jgi:hypothetical protein
MPQRKASMRWVRGSDLVGVRSSSPNIALEPTPSSLRCASASRRGSPRALGDSKQGVEAKGEELFINLLFAMAVDVGYKFDRVQLKKGAYSPMAHGNLEFEQSALRRLALQVLSGEQALKMSIASLPVDEAALKAQGELQRKLLEAFEGGYAPVMHAWPGVSKTSEVAECRPRGHRPGALPPTQGLAGVDHRGQPPGLHRGGQCVGPTRQPCGVVGACAAVFLAHARLSGRGPAPLAAPAQGRWAPGGSARLAALWPQQERLEPPWGRLESAQGICTGAVPRMASAAPWGPGTGGRSPERLSRASGSASRRWGLPRAPACLGSSAGAPP